MPRMPGAVWRPITARKRRNPIKPERVNYHVAVSEAASLHGYFNVAGRVDSHFYVLKSGTIEQYVDTSVEAYADLQGNPTTISVETQGGLRNPDGEKWTAAQVEALAKIAVWAHKTHGIPLTLARDSKPGASSRGLSWHRLGVPGSFPNSWPLWGLRVGGLKYSNAAGKTCPGTAKIHQMPDVLARAKALNGGGGAPTTAAPSKAVAALLADLDYADVRAAQTDLGLVVDGVAGPITTRALEAEMSKLDQILDRVTKTNHAVGRIEPIVRALAAAPEGGDIDPADIAHIRKRVGQNNSALSRLDPGKAGERK